MDRFIQKLYSRMEHSLILQCIKNGLVMMMPILLTGSFTQVLRSLPCDAYQHILLTFMSGAIYKLLTFIYNATFGLLAVYMTISIAVSYTRQKMPAHSSGFGAVCTALSCFGIFSGAFSATSSAEAFGADGMFTAIVCGLFASFLYCRLEEKFSKLVRLYTDGADGDFKSAVAAVIPSMLVILLFSVINLFLIEVFHVEGFQDGLLRCIQGLFIHARSSLGTAVLFILVSNLLWFFGIHGENVLVPVSQELFTHSHDMSIYIAQAQDTSAGIFCNTFFNIFVTVGGSGATLCLLIAVLLFGQRRNEKNLARVAAAPVLFNVNEILVFGLPVVFNPIMFIPFLLTPVMMVLTSSFAMYTGLVPLPVNTVEWTTPVLLGGYLATGSVSGAILQAVNIVLGVLIYKPFIRIHDKQSEINAKYRMDELTELYQKSEEECHPAELLAMREPFGGVTRSLAEDLVFRIQNQLPDLYYQPQYDYEGNCIGAEALLRWKHPLYGMVYPPMIIKLAEETGQLECLEKAVYRTVIKDMDQLLEVLGGEAKISVNVSGFTIQTDEFEIFLKELCEAYPDKCRHICIEVTEQTALQINDALIERLTRIHDMGYVLAIDDFSMGSTSIKYLQSSVFDLVKLDGALSRDIVSNSRSRDIIASIASLSNNFGINVLAEYVETEDQRKMLEGAGCKLYQGYLYSCAVPIGQLEKVKTESGGQNI